MSNPSFSNIDLWLFELAEGNLTAEQIEQLEAFMIRHPELEVDRDVWEMTKIKSSEIQYPYQNKLRRKPIAWYVAGAASIILVLSVGGYYYSDSEIKSGLLPADENSSTLFEKMASHEILVDGSDIQSDLDNSVLNVIPLGIIKNVPKEVNKVAINNDEVISVPYDLNELHATMFEEANSNERIDVNGTNRNENNVGMINTSTTSSENNVGELFLNEDGTNHEGMIENVPPLNNVIAVQSYSEVSELRPKGLKKIDNNYHSELEVARTEKTESWDSFIFDYPQYNPESENNLRSTTFSSDNYRLTFKQKLNKFSREIRRMMDNPIALTNFRDPYYHVPGMLPNDVNFSSTGTMLSTRVQTISRLQWHGEKNEQLLSQLAIDGYVYGMRGGIGLQINHAMYNDGGLNITSASITYSPKLSVSRTISIEPSLRFKMGNKSLTNSKMNNVDQVELDRGNPHDFYADGTDPTGNDLWFRDIGLGLMVNTEWFFAGAQIDNLFRHKDNIYTHDAQNPRRADYHFVGTIGADWVSKKEHMSASNYLVYQSMENLSELWLGANLRYKWFTFGGAVSSNFDPSASIGMKFKHFALTYNADYTQSKMIGDRALSHQLTLRFVAKPNSFGRQLLNL
jgi:type IX secretion system PorP/SprF family membrane protein